MTGSNAFTPFFWPSVGTGLFLLALSAYTWRRRDVPGVLPFTIGGLLNALWVTGNIIYC